MGCTDRSVPKALLGVSANTSVGGLVHEQLDKYLGGGPEGFDFLTFSCVYDFRPLQMSWEDFCHRLSCKNPAQWCGRNILGVALMRTRAYLRGRLAATNEAPAGSESSWVVVSGEP